MGIEDPVALRELGLLVDVDLDDAKLVAPLVRDLIEDGRDGTARAAPLRPEVDDHRGLALEHLGVELSGRDWVCHTSPNVD